MEKKATCMVLIEHRQITNEGFEQPFKIGDNVEWIVAKSGVEILNGVKLDYYYDKHYDYNEYDTRMFKIAGTVNTITAPYHRYEPYSCPPEIISGRKVPRKVFRKVYENAIDRVEASGHENDIDGLSCDSYVVEIGSCSIQPVTLEEVKATW